jgi:hypothetical protein
VFLQVALASEAKWVGALHPLGALFVLVLVTVLLRRRRVAWTAERALRAGRLCTVVVLGCLLRALCGD